MNLTNKFITSIIDKRSIQNLISLKYVNGFLSTFIQPVIASVTVILNFIVMLVCLIVFFKTRRKNLKPAFVLIGALSFVDMIFGIDGLTSIAKVYFQDALSCKTFYMFGNFIQWLSQLILIALTVDRYIFIKKPLHYPLIMTPCTTFILLVVPFIITSILAFLSNSIFELPAEDPYGQMCVWFHVFPGWMQISYAMLYSLLLVVVMLIYAEMLIKFSQSRKKLEELHKSMREEDYTRSNLTFHQTKGVFNREKKSEVAGVSNEPIQTLKIKSLENGQQIKDKNGIIYNKKRRSSSVVKKMAVLVSQTRAATYILVLVAVYFITWAPVYVYMVYDPISHMILEDFKQTNLTTDHSSLIFSCLDAVLQQKDCHVELDVDSEEMARNMFHLLQASNIGYIIGYFLTFFHTMANPILYAFLYSDFRNYLLQIPGWFQQMGWKRKKEEPDDFKFEMKIVKI